MAASASSASTRSLTFEGLAFASCWWPAPRCRQGGWWGVHFPSNRHHNHHTDDHHHATSTTTTTTTATMPPPPPRPPRSRPLPCHHAPCHHHHHHHHPATSHHHHHHHYHRVRGRQMTVRQVVASPLASASGGKPPASWRHDEQVLWRARLRSGNNQQPPLVNSCCREGGEFLPLGGGWE